MAAVVLWTASVMGTDQRIVAFPQQVKGCGEGVDGNWDGQEPQSSLLSFGCSRGVTKGGV